MVRLPVSVLLALAVAGCDPTAPPPATWSDLDAARPDAAFLGGIGGSGLPSGGGGGTTAPPACGARVLVVFDRSGSMNEPWLTAASDEPLPRWRVASDAVTAALEPLAARVTAGAILFPTSMERTPDTCAEVAPIDAQIPFRDGRAFLDAWAARWSTPEVGGSTPVDRAFARAEEALPFDDEVTAVVLLTDGMPTCSEPTSAWDRAASFARRDVKTWVVGLPGAAGLSVLDRIAAAGGTGASLSVDDPAALTSALSTIVSDALEQACP